MVYFGIDYGLKRIGVAISDNGIMARPLCCVLNRGDGKNVASIRDLIVRNTRYGVVHNDILLCIGVPNGVMAERCRSFGALLERELNKDSVGIGFRVKVAYVDENFSSIQAEEYIRDVMGVRDWKKVKELLDAVAACMILNTYIEHRAK